MKYILIQKNHRLFKSGWIQQPRCAEFESYVFYRCEAVTTNIQPTGRPSEMSMESCSKLQTALQQYWDSKQSEIPLQRTSFWDIYVGVGVEISTGSSRDADYLNGFIEVRGALPGNCLQALLKLYGKDATLQVFISVTEEDSRSGTSTLISTKEMHLNPIITSSMPSCWDASVKFPATYFRNWKDSEGLNAELKVMLSLNKPGRSPSATDLSVTEAMNRKILEEEILSDVVIVAANGADIKAHNNILSAQSPVFLAMFQSDMIEARESTVEIPDMGEESVRALLKYLYYNYKQFDDMASISSFEMFQAGHKYGISLLEELMREIILEKSKEWYGLDVAVKLFLFARNLTPPDEELKVRAIQALKMFKANLEDSPNIQELFRNDAKAALELLKYALSVE